MRLETLEPRIALDGSRAVGDASFVLYDGVTYGTLEAEFSRGVATLDPTGTPVAADEPRYGEPMAYSPAVEWTKVTPDFWSTGPLSFSIKVLASGWDADGETALTVFETGRSRFEIIFARGDELQEVGRMPLQGPGSIEQFEPDRRYFVRGAIVYDGLVVFAAERSQDFGEGFVPVGVDFFATQDYGQTLEKIGSADGGTETPALEASRGIPRLQPWSFMNPFPVEGADATQSVWFPWADYIIRESPGPNGGQVGLFRADRDPSTGLWDFGPNRVVYETWRENGSDGFHSHAAAVTTGGLISHWGDVSYRNVTMFHEFDLENYATASVSTVEAQGAFTGDPSDNRPAPQPAAVAPSPVPGEHFATGDETPDALLRYGAMNTTDDRLEVESVRYQPRRIARGNLYDGPAMLHVDWLRDAGYIVAGRVDAYFYFSRDGVHWSEVNAPLNENGTMFLLGADTLMAMREGDLYVAEAPPVDVVRPLLVQPGETNRMGVELEERRAPGAGNALRRVEWSGDVWRYTDTLEPLDVQAGPPTFDTATPVYEVTSDGTSVDFGQWWLAPEGTSVSSGAPLVLDARVYNLGDQGFEFGPGVGVVGPTGAASGQPLGFSISDNSQWVKVGASDPAETVRDGRPVMTLRTTELLPGTRYLLALPYLGSSAGPTYTLPPGQTGPDESATVSGFELVDNWSAGFVARWPDGSQMRAPIKMPIGSFVGTEGDAIEVSIDFSAPRLLGRADVVIDYYDDTLLVDTQSYRWDLLWGDTIEVALSEGPAGVSAAVVVSGDEVTLLGEPETTVDLTLDRFQWADRTGDTRVGVEPMLVFVDEDTAWNDAEQTEWLQSSLADKAVYGASAGPGDFNFDGIVDNADRDLWQATLFVPNPGGPGDATLDGFVEDDDAAVWAAQFGSDGRVPADLNGDGVVNLADQTIILDSLGAVAERGLGDADGDGVVDQDDHAVFVAEFGQVGSDLRADFNADGVVDLLDYTFFADNVGASYPAPIADIDGSGVVDDADLAIWSATVGQVAEEFVADFNGDAVVGLADYTVWRDNRGPQLPPGTGADADGNGYVQQADLPIWEANQGNEYPTFGDLIAAAQIASAATAPATASAAAIDQATRDEVFAGTFALAQDAPESESVRPVEPTASRRGERGAALARARTVALLINARAQQPAAESRPIDSDDHAAGAGSDEDEPLPSRVGGRTIGR
ncbi:MAG: hypothetical protein AAFV43_05270 [Planctomycetota bacterium]